MHRILKANIPLAAFALLAGCFSSTPQMPILYDLDLPSAAGEAKTLPMRVALEPVSSAPQLERVNLLWRDADHPVQVVFDPVRRWKAPPPSMVREAFLDRARDGAWFDSIGVGGDPGPFTHAIRMRLRAFEEIHRMTSPAGGGKPEEAWFGLLDVEFQLYPLDRAGGPGTFLRFREERRAERRDPEAVARALSALLAEAFDKFRGEAERRAAR